MYAHGGKAAIAQRVHSRKRDIGPIPARGQEILQEHFGGLCAYCSTRPATTWDHVIPISKGGKTHPGSIVPACMACNSSKKNTNLAAWLTSKQIPLNDNLIDILLLAEVLPYEHCDFN
jgi:5-methylcytosine-specific restriction endonuclease McrA